MDQFVAKASKFAACLRVSALLLASLALMAQGPCTQPQPNCAPGLLDSDNDGIADACDNCPEVPNADQSQDNNVCVHEDVAWHLEKSVDLGWVGCYEPTDLAECTTQSEDVAEDRLPCDAYHSVQALHPRHAFFLGNSWISTCAGDVELFNDSPLQDVRNTLGIRVKGWVDALHEVAPNMIASAHLAEIAFEKWLPPGVQWPEVCRPGTVDVVHGPGTCVPDSWGGGDPTRVESS